MFVPEGDVKREVARIIGEPLERMGYRAKRGHLPAYISTHRENGLGAAVWYQLASWEDAYYLPRVDGATQPLAVRVELGVAPVGPYMYNEAKAHYRANLLRPRDARRPRL